MARDFSRQPKEFEERIIEIKRVSKKTKGGSKIGFTAMAVIGNRQGTVGAGLGKATTVPAAIQKAITRAKEQLVEVNIAGDTIPHVLKKKFKGAQILMKPAPKGSGIIAGGAIRDVVELAGVKDISAKMLGSNNKSSNVECAIRALGSLKLREQK